MKSTNRFALVLSCACLSVLAGSAPAQDMPQDNWVHVRSWAPLGTNAGAIGAPATGTPVGGIATDTNGTIYVTDPGNRRIQAFTTGGDYVRKWSGGGGINNLVGPRGIVCGADGLIYVADPGASRVQVYSATGTLVRQWGSNGSGNGQFRNGSVMPIAIGADGVIYVGDAANQRIQAFTTNGTFLRKWGTLGSGFGQFGAAGPTDLSVTPDGLIAAVDHSNGRIQYFTPVGDYVRQRTPANYFLAISSDGVEVGDTGIFFGTNRLHDVPATIGPIHLSKDDVLYYGVTGGYQNVFGGFALSADARTYRTIASSNATMPRPVILSVGQRAGAPWIDVDYTVNGAGTGTVHVAALGFVDGADDLGSVVRLSTLLEGTATNLGAGIPVGTTNHLTWNVAADWATNLANVAVELLAKDGRDLLGFHFITIPSNGANPQVTIDRSPLTQGQLLSCWYWLIATNDPAITLSTGSVVGVGGPYAGQVLATGTNTTSAGRSFLFARLGVREATPAEVTVARGGTSGMNNQWAPRVTVGPGVSPRAVNEVGFDTGDWGTNAWYVVPVAP